VLGKPAMTPLHVRVAEDEAKSARAAA